jgi:hypothetical protein
MGRMRRAATLGGELKLRGLNPDQAGLLAEVHPTTIRRIIRGSVRAQPRTVVDLAKALGIGAPRMRQMCDAHWLDAHPDEDLRGGERNVPAA